MSLVAVVFCVAATQNTAQIPVVRPGEKILGQVSAQDRMVRSETLDKATASSSPARGQRCELRIEKRGDYTIELYSSFFDSYLVVRPKDGATIEDDDGLPFGHARVARSRLSAAAP